MTYPWRHILFVVMACSIVSIAIAKYLDYQNGQTRRARMEACFSGLSEESRKTFRCDEFLEIQKPI